MMEHLQVDTSFSGGQLNETTVVGPGTTRNIVNIDRITGHLRNHWLMEIMI